MVIIRTYDPSEIEEITRILAPAFKDKVAAVIGDDAKALRVIPTIIRSIEGTILVATDEHSNEMVGAIIVSVSEFKITLPIVFACLKVLGIGGSWHAFRMVNDYLKSEPKKLDGEGRLEAVGVLDSNRGQGIGKELTMAGENYLREQGLSYYGLGVKTDNPAYHLYCKLGFEEIIRYHNSLDNWIYMRKQLK